MGIKTICITPYFLNVFNNSLTIVGCKGNDIHQLMFSINLLLSNANSFQAVPPNFYSRGPTDFTVLAGV